MVADAQHLRQVLTNLVDNAIKYSPDGGPVRLSIRRQDGYVRFAVRTRASASRAAEQDRIFEKFYRLDPEHDPRRGGTGLGLYICRALVRQLHGRIWVTSQEGKGSTFFVEIPVASAAPGSVARAALARGRPVRVRDAVARADVERPAGDRGIGRIGCRLRAPECLAGARVEPVDRHSGPEVDDPAGHRGRGRARRDRLRPQPLAVRGAQGVEACPRATT